jgi:hypothetical protein
MITDAVFIAMEGDDEAERSAVTGDCHRGD